MSGMTFRNPFLIASGPPGDNAGQMIRAARAGWGGIVGKTYSLSDNPTINVKPRYAKYRSPKQGIIGFQNIELISDESCEQWIQWNKETKDAVGDSAMLIASLMEFPEKARWQELTERTVESGVDGIELNLSCPHGQSERGMGSAMGQNPEMVEMVTSWVVESAKGVPVWAKMTPNITDIRVPAQAAVKGGAHGISAINTILATIGINHKTLEPLPTVMGHSTFGGYSYKAIKPIASRMIAEMKMDQPNIPISGIGGVASSVDAIDHILMGATTVQSCAAPMMHGFGMVGELCEGLEKFMDLHKFETVDDMVGYCLKFYTSHGALVQMQHGVDIHHLDTYCSHEPKAK